jgi:hypothetical protein
MFARAAAERRDWPEALLFAEDVAWRALRRGLVRLAAEGSLLAAETGRDSGDDAVRERHAAVLANLLPQLRSRDLDARAEAIGVVVPVAAMEK